MTRLTCFNACDLHSQSGTGRNEPVACRAIVGVPT